MQLEDAREGIDKDILGRGLSLRRYRLFTEQYIIVDAGDVCEHSAWGMSDSV